MNSKTFTFNFSPKGRMQWCIATQHDPWISENILSYEFVSKEEMANI